MFIFVQKKLYIRFIFITHKVLVVPKFITLILNWNTNNLYIQMTATTYVARKKISSYNT